MSSWGPAFDLIGIVHSPFDEKINFENNSNVFAIYCPESMEKNRDEQMRHSLITMGNMMISRDIKWLAIGNDHTFWIVENLRCYLSSFNSSQPFYL